MIFHSFEYLTGINRELTNDNIIYKVFNESILPPLINTVAMVRKKKILDIYNILYTIRGEFISRNCLRVRILSRIIKSAKSSSIILWKAEVLCYTIFFTVNLRGLNVLVSVAILMV